MCSVLIVKGFFDPKMKMLSFKHADVFPTLYKDLQYSLPSAFHITKVEGDLYGHIYIY